jgi:hypothetical protein
LASHISSPSRSAKSRGPARQVRFEKDKIFAYLNLNDIELQVYDQYYEMLGAGANWNGDPLEPPVIPAKAPVIPAKAGIQSDDSTFPKACGVDSSRHGGTGMTRPPK